MPEIPEMPDIPNWPHQPDPCRSGPVHSFSIIEQFEGLDSIDDADVLITSKAYYRQRAKIVADAESRNVPIYVLRSNSQAQMDSCLVELFNVGSNGVFSSVDAAMTDASRARGVPKPVWVVLVVVLPVIGAILWFAIGKGRTGAAQVAGPAPDDDPRFTGAKLSDVELERLRELEAVSYTHLRAHETVLDLVCRLLLEKKK